MYPCIFWWNPTIYFPLSGPVTQDWDPTITTHFSSVERRLHLLTDAVLETAASTYSVEQKPGPALENLLTLKIELDTLDSDKKMRIAQTKTLLDLLHSLDPEEFKRIVQTTAATKE